MTIVEFLLARIAEDEALAEAAIDDHPHWLAMGHDLYQHEGGVVSGYLAVDRRAPQGVEHIANWDPARVLAECQAKRAIVEAASDYVSEFENEEWRTEDTMTAGRVAGRARSWRADTLRTLAAVYADHPDYRDEWQPT